MTSQCCPHPSPAAVPAGANRSFPFWRGEATGVCGEGFSGSLLQSRWEQRWKCPLPPRSHAVVVFRKAAWGKGLSAKQVSQPNPQQHQHSKTGSAGLHPQATRRRWQHRVRQGEGFLWHLGKIQQALQGCSYLRLICKLRSACRAAAQTAATLAGGRVWDLVLNCLPLLPPLPPTEPASHAPGMPPERPSR